MYKINPCLKEASKLDENEFFAVSLQRDLHEILYPSVKKFILVSLFKKNECVCNVICGIHVYWIRHVI